MAAMLPLWLGWTQGLRAASHMLLVGAIGLVLYKFLKRTLVRERPFIGLVGIAASLSAQVLARRKEFGLLAHLGVTQRQVLAVVAGEAAVWRVSGGEVARA